MADERVAGMGEHRAADEPFVWELVWTPFERFPGDGVYCEVPHQLSPRLTHLIERYLEGRVDLKLALDLIRDLVGMLKVARQWREPKAGSGLGHSALLARLAGKLGHPANEVLDEAAVDRLAASYLALLEAAKHVLPAIPSHGVSQDQLDALYAAVLVCGRTKMPFSPPVAARAAAVDEAADGGEMISMAEAQEVMASMAQDRAALLIQLHRAKMLRDDLAACLRCYVEKDENLSDDEAPALVVAARKALKGVEGAK